MDLKKEDISYSIVGTNIDDVKRENAQSGLSYNEVKALLAQQGGFNTKIYSDTNVDEIRKQLNNNNK
ncbi:gamma-type small acid-soluble spore protein [Bacillus sp. Marseille-P3661]|uniref:gamma-type small acid-soluble spore protein n=1 Tax=Bacillus sp. Marseille-P3661 TaxID=1936234 RepID=UPI000C85632D|nr:gamma-type small acid-soluble spore protein [Bacillus sp. Marseille-P3661]